jgi:tRNA-dihydrouridine synthase
MMRETGCDGVVVGRGCLGRPWLFRDLAAVFAGKEPENPPDFGEIMQTMREHARLLCEWAGPRHGIRDFRKHATWYTKGFPGSTKMRDKLIRIESLEELDAILAEGDPELAFPRIAMRAKRGKKGGRQRVVLPEGFRNDLQDATPPAVEEPGGGG